MCKFKLTKLSEKEMEKVRGMRVVGSGFFVNITAPGGDPEPPMPSSLPVECYSCERFNICFP